MWFPMNGMRILGVNWPKMVGFWGVKVGESTEKLCLELLVKFYIVDTLHINVKKFWALQIKIMTFIGYVKSDNCSF